ncbi:hypothetical protein ACLOJK_016240 [Asimina triloba]
MEVLNDGFLPAGCALMLVEASLAKASVSTFSDLGTWVTLTFSICSITLLIKDLLIWRADDYVDPSSCTAREVVSVHDPRAPRAQLAKAPTGAKGSVMGNEVGINVTRGIGEGVLFVATVTVVGGTAVTGELSSFRQERGANDIFGRLSRREGTSLFTLREDELFFSSLRVGSGTCDILRSHCK